MVDAGLGGSAGSPCDAADRCRHRLTRRQPANRRLADASGDGARRDLRDLLPSVQAARMAADRRAVLPRVLARPRSPVRAAAGRSGRRRDRRSPGGTWRPRACWVSGRSPGCSSPRPSCAGWPAASPGPRWPNGTGRRCSGSVSEVPGTSARFRVGRAGGTESARDRDLRIALRNDKGARQPPGALVIAVRGDAQAGMLSRGSRGSRAGSHRSSRSAPASNSASTGQNSPARPAASGRPASCTWRRPCPCHAAPCRW